MVLRHIYLKNELPSSIINMDKTSLLTKRKKRKTALYKRPLRRYPEIKHQLALVQRFYV